MYEFHSQPSIIILIYKHACRACALHCILKKFFFYLKMILLIILRCSSFVILIKTMQTYILIGHVYLLYMNILCVRICSVGFLWRLAIKIATVDGLWQLKQYRCIKSLAKEFHLFIILYSSF